MSLVVGGHSWWSAGGGAAAGTAGKSAVQLLQESKSQYVKSDLVLGTNQRPARPDRFHISSNPNIFLNAPAHTLHASRLSPDPPRRSPAIEDQTDSATVPDTQPTQIAVLTPSALAQHTNKCSGVAPLPLRIQRGAPRPRAKTQPIGDPFNRSGDLRRSLSHGPADKGEDVQMKLRRLLDVGSKEKLCPDSPTKKSTPELSEILTGTGTFRAEPVKVTVHKSLPDLSKSIANVVGQPETDCQTGDIRRPSCPSAISTDKAPKTNFKPEVKPKPAPKPPPPVPPRKSREPLRPLPQPPKDPPELPKRISPKTTPPRIPPRSKITLESDTSGNIAGPIHPTAIEMCRRNSDSDASAAGGSEDMRRRPILRSKSDVTHERCLLGQKDEDECDSRTSLNKEDLENFFESMGLDRCTYQEVMSPTDETSPLYFEEGSSNDSIPRRCSSDEDGQQPQEAALRPGEPSIVEKNARIIKWLFTCQRAQGCLSQRPSTKSS